MTRWGYIRDCSVNRFRVSLTVPMFRTPLSCTTKLGTRNKKAKKADDGELPFGLNSSATDTWVAPDITEALPKPTDDDSSGLDSGNTSAKSVAERGVGHLSKMAQATRMILTRIPIQTVWSRTPSHHYHRYRHRLWYFHLLHHHNHHQNLYSLLG